MRCAIWYHLYNFKNVKNTHGGVLISVKLQASACTKISTPPWVFFAFFKLCKLYQIAQHITYSRATSYLNCFNVHIIPPYAFYFSYS